MSAERPLVGCTLHDGADIDACGCPALDSPGAIAYRGLLVKARAEIARLTAELARVTECYSESHAAVGQLTRDIDAGREIDRQNVAEVNRLTAELAAARAVPADVEAAMRHYGEVNSSPCWTAKGHADAEDTLRTAIARAISDATAARGTVGGLLATAPVGSIVEFVSPDGMYHQAVVAGGRLLSRRWQHALSHSPGDWTLYAFWLDGAYLRLPARLVPAAEADADPSQRGPLPKGG